MNYDGVITKPELTEENMLMHWGVKGMKWKKRLKGAYYRGKNKLTDIRTRFNRNLNFNSTMDVTNNYGKTLKRPGGYTVAEALATGTNGLSGKIKLRDMKMNGRANSVSGQEGSRVDAGIAAGRQRALRKSLQNSSTKRPSSRKKKVISGTTSVKKRGVAR